MNSIEPRPGFRHHQTGEQNAGERPSHFAHRLHRRLDNLAHDAILHRGVDDRRRRIGAHAAGVRPLVAVVRGLVVLRGGKRYRDFAIAQREEARFLAFHEFLDDDRSAGIAERLVDHRVVDGGAGFVHRSRDRDALARGKPVGLHHNRRALFAHIGFRGFGIGETAIGGGRNARARAKVFHKSFGAFDFGGELAGAETCKTRRAQFIGEALCQLALRGR